MISEETKSKVTTIVVASDKSVKDTDNAMMLDDVVFVPTTARMALNDKGYPFGVFVMFMDTKDKGHLRLLRKSSIMSENEDTSQPRFPQFNAEASASILCKSSYVSGVRELMGKFIKVTAEHNAKGFNWNRTDAANPVMDKTTLIPKRILAFSIVPTDLTDAKLKSLNDLYEKEIKDNFPNN